MSRSELHQASARQKWKTAGRAPGKIQPRPRGRGAPPRQPQGHPALPDRYLVEMRVPGNIVTALLQGHRARRAGLGVAGSGGCRGRPARDGAAGPAPQGRQPCARAQRGAHGPCADLAPGRNQGQGRLTANHEPRAPQGTESEPRLRPRVKSRGSGRVKGASPRPSSAATCVALPARLRCAGLAKPPAKRKQAQEADPVRLTSRAIPAPIPARKRQLLSEGPPRTSSLAQWLASIPSFPRPPVLRPELMWQAGRVAAVRCSPPANGWTSTAAARAPGSCVLEREVPEPLFAVRGFL